MEDDDIIIGRISLQVSVEETKEISDTLMKPKSTFLGLQKHQIAGAPHCWK
jgi:hypothetical protein